MKSTFSIEATQQLIDLELYLADRFYPENSWRFVERITAACHAIAEIPQRGTPRNDVGPGIRSISFERKVTIYFDVHGDLVRILTIQYGGRRPRKKDLKYPKF
jgi:toxin ParE1/3/4